MNNQLPDDVLAFGGAVRERLQALGGVRFALQAEADDSSREAAGGALAELGAWDVDPRAGVDELLAAAQLCRMTGAAALPYPVVDQLLATEGARLALIDPRAPLVDHGDLPGDWVGADLDGAAYRLVPGRRGMSRLGPFVTAMTLGDPSTTVASGDVARHLLLGSWRLLGGLEAALALASEHVVARKQFGKALAEFQAVRFAVADATVAVRGLEELAKYTAWRIGTSAGNGGDAAMVDAVALRLHADDVAVEVLHCCHQMLGAMGFCDEHDLSVLDRHLQPLLRLPCAAEALVDRLVPAVSAGEFEALFTRI
jgi:hypothetical protein